MSPARGPGGTVVRHEKDKGVVSDFCFFERIQDDPEITNRVFSAMRLEHSGQDLYKLVERLREEAAR